LEFVALIILTPYCAGNARRDAESAKMTWRGQGKEWSHGDLDESDDDKEEEEEQQPLWRSYIVFVLVFIGFPGPCFRTVRDGDSSSDGFPENQT
jgi:hypothetical protein